MDSLARFSARSAHLKRELGERRTERHPPSPEGNNPLTRRADPDCEPADPANTVTDRLNTLLRNGGPGYTLRLCPNERYMIQAPITFAHPNQEISTLGYPTDDERATLVVSGPVQNGEGHTVAVDGTCNDCDGVKLRNIQIDGDRGNAPPTKGGGNIEMGGDNSNQLIEYVRTYNPRSWTCLHIAEGPLSCNNVTIQYNDIGPCGVDTFQEWADGISLACRNSLVKENLIFDATDGGIVVFGSPGSVIEDNTIWVANTMLLGGINIVDYNPFDGDYRGTVVRRNNIIGGFANDGQEPGDTHGFNNETAIIKIGIGIGPRTWFGDRYGESRNNGGMITSNTFSGAFSYAIAITSANNFTVLDNKLVGNTAFIGARGPNCSDSDHVPEPAPFIVDWATVGTDMNKGSGKVQDDFVGISDGDSLTCVLPPNGGDFWPFGTNPGNTAEEAFSDKNKDDEGGSPVGIVVGVVIGIIALGVILFFARKWYMRKMEEKRCFEASRQMAQKRAYTQQLP
ncbi:hypothetical protein CC2G_001626 [Coprinopsis cinerea AmutBmut pab1-1]|nr:hypothetical protein CC2G_001626 [Coprinopsis cinerea AmutBmut pab1-1]